MRQLDHSGACVCRSICILGHAMLLFQMRASGNLGLLVDEQVRHIAYAQHCNTVRCLSEISIPRKPYVCLLHHGMQCVAWEALSCTLSRLIFDIYADFTTRSKYITAYLIACCILFKRFWLHLLSQSHMNLEELADQRQFFCRAKLGLVALKLCLLHVCYSV